MGCVSTQPQSHTKKQLNTNLAGQKAVINPEKQALPLLKQSSKQNKKPQQDAINNEKQKSTIKLQKILSQQQKKSPYISQLKTQTKQNQFHAFQDQAQQPFQKNENIPNLPALKNQSQLKTLPNHEQKIKLNLDQIDQRNKSSQITKRVSQSNPSNIRGLQELGIISQNKIIEVQDQNNTKSILSRPNQNKNSNSKVHSSGISNDKEPQILKETQIRVDFSGDNQSKPKSNIRNTETLQQVNQEDYTILHQQSLQIGGGFDPRALVIDMNKVAW